MSPALFALAHDSFSEYLNWHIRNKKLKVYKNPNVSTAISHLCFADDMLVLLNGSRDSILKLLEIIQNYERVFGQHINKGKTSFVAGKFVSTSTTEISDLTGYKADSLPIQNLGIPLFKGKPKTKYFDKLRSKISVKLDGWQSSLPTASGKLILIKSTLCSIPMHLLSVLKAPKLVIDSIH